MTFVREFDFEVPKELVAQFPLTQRTHSRLLHIDCHRQAWRDRQFAQIEQLIEPQALLVVNDTKVIPARFFAELFSTATATQPQRRIECLYLRSHPANRIEVMAKPMRRLKVGAHLRIGEQFLARVCEKQDQHVYLEIAKPDAVDVDASGAEDILESFLQWLKLEGQIPLPPYLGRQAVSLDQQRYQTVYAKQYGAVAAPTAGLHFNQALLDSLEQRGVEIGRLSLNIGVGTFAPMRTEHIEDHLMHTEDFCLSSDLLAKLDRARCRGDRVIAVGTTVVRALESAAASGQWSDKLQTTQLMISPGYPIKVVDALVTNFHLPRSTLFVMICALVGKSLAHQCYQHAIESAYRFYSYGDAMLIDNIRAEHACVDKLGLAL